MNSVSFESQSHAQSVHTTVICRAELILRNEFSSVDKILANLLRGLYCGVEGVDDANEGNLQTTVENQAKTSDSDIDLPV